MGFNKLMGFEIWSHIKSVSQCGEESVNIWCGQTIIKCVHLFNLMFKKKLFYHPIMENNFPFSW